MTFLFFGRFIFCYCLKIFYKKIMASDEEDDYMSDKFLEKK